jgi:hypothetical protein
MVYNIFINERVGNMSKRKSHGHYCYICGNYKSNESFSGRGHTLHICKSCSKKKNKDSSVNFDQMDFIFVDDTLENQRTDDQECPDVDIDDLPF